MITAALALALAAVLVGCTSAPLVGGGTQAATSAEPTTTEASSGVLPDGSGGSSKPEIEAMDKQLDAMQRELDSLKMPTDNDFGSAESALY